MIIFLKNRTSGSCNCCSCWRVRVAVSRAKFAFFSASLQMVVRMNKGNLWEKRRKPKQNSQLFDPCFRGGLGFFKFFLCF